VILLYALARTVIALKMCDKQSLFMPTAICLASNGLQDVKFVNPNFINISGMLLNDYHNEVLNIGKYAVIINL